MNGAVPETTGAKFALSPGHFVKLTSGWTLTACFTVTVKVQVLLLLEASVATLVTVVVPTGKVEPDGGVETTVTLPQLSVALTKKVTLLRLHCPASAAKLMLVGQRTILGFWVSLIVTVKVQVLLLLEESVATLVTVVVPTGKVEPDGGVETTVTLPQLSVAVTKKVTLLLLHWPVSADKIMLVGQRTMLGF